MELDVSEWKREFHPCRTGVSVFQPEGGKHGGLTLKNYPGANGDVVKRLSSAGTGDDFDLVCDVYYEGDLVDTIPIRRQDLRAIDAELSSRPSP